MRTHNVQFAIQRFIFSCLGCIPDLNVWNSAVSQTKQRLLESSWNAGELAERETSDLFVDLETQDIANGTTGSTLKKGNDQTQVAYC